MARPTSAFVAFLFTTTFTTLALAQGQEASPTETPQVQTSTASSGAYGQRSLTGPAGQLSLLAGPVPANLDLAGLGAGTLEPGLNKLFIKDPEICFGGFCTEVEISDPLFLNLGGSYSILDQLDVGALVLLLELDPEVELQDPVLWVRYRAVDGDAEVAVQALAVIPIEGSFWMEVGAPVRFRGDLRIDTGGYLSFDDSGNFSLRVPGTIAANVTPNVFLGGRTAIVVPDLDFGDTLMPLEAFVGYTLAGGGPTVDFTLLFGFPAFLAFGGYADDYGEIITELFHVSLGASFHFDVGGGGGTAVSPASPTSVASSNWTSGLLP